MATNPQTDFDDEWGDWPSGGSTESPVIGQQASISWGVANVRSFTKSSVAVTDPGLNRGTQQSSLFTNQGSSKSSHLFGNQVGNQESSKPQSLFGNQDSSKPSSTSRGRGQLRNMLFARNNASEQPVGRPIFGRPADNVDADASKFDFKAMVSSLNANSSTAESGNGANTNDRPDNSSFSFRNTMPVGDNDRQTTQESVPTPNNDEPVLEIDGQVSYLEGVLKQTNLPTDLEHVRKLESLRQDPNHPLFSQTTFESMDLKVELKEGLSADHKMRLSAIQEKTLPFLNSPPYRNCIAQSQNGTGKTVAFVVTMLNRVDLEKPHVQALCLLPTKELAQQVVETAQRLGRKFPRIDELIFAAVRDSQRVNIEAILNSCNKMETPIIVGTAGSVNNLMRRKRFDLDKIVVFVVDEADKMLDRESHNFYTTIGNIVGRLQSQAQRVFFSATFSDEVVEEAKKFMSDPLVIRVRDEELSLDNIRHFYMRVRNKEDRLTAMKLIYSAMTVGQSIVFCRTRQSSHWLCNELRNQLGFQVAELSGDMDPRERDEQINRFRRSADRVLVTTNVSARGLDISSVNLIINWDPPTMHDTGMADFDTYLHRVGRSGRFGADGIAVNMVEREADLRIFKQIEQHFNIQVKPLSSKFVDMEKAIGNRD